MVASASQPTPKMSADCDVSDHKSPLVRSPSQAPASPTAPAFPAEVCPLIGCFYYLPSDVAWRSESRSRGGAGRGRSSALRLADPEGSPRGRGDRSWGTAQRGLRIPVPKTGSVTAGSRPATAGGAGRRHCPSRYLFLGSGMLSQPLGDLVARLGVRWGAPWMRRLRAGGEGEGPGARASVRKEALRRAGRSWCRTSLGARFT